MIPRDPNRSCCIRRRLGEMLKDEPQVADVDGYVGLLLHNRLCAECNADAGDFHHVEIIRAVANCDSAFQGNAVQCSELT